ncbi:MAG: coproporphyrinogen dehydrogenase HemZ, partial [Parasporobacterium sp.]|nr:coproporphyrinogen dehydrogenase HemZ [Parasporobacterium sp.]
SCCENHASNAVNALAGVPEENLTKDAANAFGQTYESEVNEMLRFSRESASRQGLNPYYLYRQKSIAGNFENIGFAKPGFEGLYNVLMMEEVQSIIACGAGASTKYVSSDGAISRSFNVKDVNSYINQIDEMISRKNAR